MHDVSTVNEESLQSELTYTAASFGPVQFFKRLSTVSESVRGALLVGMCLSYTGRSWLFTAVSLGILESIHLNLCVCLSGVDVCW